MLKRYLSSFALVTMAAAIPMADASEVALVPQTSNAMGVKVTVTPWNLSGLTETWDFDVVLETHTRKLGDDMAKSSTLIVDGKRYASIGWEGAPPGGHHRKGLLRFKAIAPPPPAVELQIRLGSENAPRKFQWYLKGVGNGN